MTTGSSQPTKPGGPGGSTDRHIIDGRAIARAIESEVAVEAERLRKAGKIPHLATVQVGQDPATELYIRNQKRRFARLGIRFTHLNLDPDTDQDGVLSLVQALNHNETITGIMLTSPLPDSLDADEVRQEILPQKDVEGLTSYNLGNLVYNRGPLGPCTALAVLEAIETTGVRLEGAQAVVVGHSDTVGKPVTLCLLRDLVTTTTCHIATRDLRSETLRADILVVAVGKPNLITGDMVKDGAVVVDVGINEIADAPGESRRTGETGRSRIVGDVQFEEVSRIAGWITPVPGGIGPITVAKLAQNTVLCARQQLERASR